MTKNTYNVIWVDDEISAILNERTIELLESEDIRVIATATHADGAGGLEELLRKHTAKGITNDRVDAVITDANFNVSEDKVNSKGERDTYGLSYVLTLTKKYETLPFYLYTGRSEEMLLNKYDDGELDRFRSSNRWFTKGVGLMPLIDQIKKDVDEFSSPEYKIRKDYYCEFLASKRIVGAEDLLTKGLLLKETESEGLELLYNETRQVLEQIQYELEKHELIPHFSSLNDASRFLSGMSVDPYIPSELIMPKALARGLFYLVQIAQDGSHNKNDEKLEVVRYTRETGRLNLFYSSLHILMEILCWFDTLIQKPEGKQKCWSKKGDN